LLEQLFFGRVGRIEDEVIHVSADVELGSGGRRGGVARRRDGARGVGGRGGGRGRNTFAIEDAREEAGVMNGGLETHALENGGELVVPMVRAAAKAVKSFIQQPILILAVSWVADWGADGHPLVIREGGLTESVFAVALLENAAVASGHGGEKAKAGVLENRRVALGLVVDSIFVVAKDNDARFGAMWAAILVWLDNQDAHGGHGLGNNALAAQGEVLLLADPVENVERLKPPFFLQV
jgi:hypothetical protein